MNAIPILSRPRAILARFFPVLVAAVILPPILNAAPTAVYRTVGGDVALTEPGSPLVYWAGGANLTQPRAAQAPNGDTFMVVLDQWGGLYARIFSAATHQWLPWRQSGAYLAGAPAIVVDSGGVAWVAARSTYGTLWLVSLTYSGFGSWTSLGGTVTSDPAIAISSSGIAHIVARDGSGSTGVVYMVRAQNGVSLGWTMVGGIIQGNPALVAGLNGTVHLLVRDPWNSAWVGVISGTTCTWGNSNYQIDTDPAGIHVNNVVTMVAARSGQIVSGAVNVTNNNPVWGPWSSMGQAGTSASAANVLTSLAVAARDLTGQLVWYQPGVGWAAYGSAFAGGAFSAGPTGSSTAINYTLTTNVSPSGGGSITPNCQSGCSYSAGSQVQITATPAAGYQFTGFTGALSGTANPQFLTMDAEKSVTANFSTVAQYQLTTGVSPSGGGTIGPNCSGGCLYSAGQVVTVTATPSPGYVFTGFTGSLTGTANPQNLTMAGPASVMANFSDTVYATDPAQLQSCIGLAGTAQVCVLVQGRHAVNTPLRIQRSGITVMGAGGPGDTTLYRNSATLGQIMIADEWVSNVAIKNLTFDGNRYGPGLGLQCPPGNDSFYDLHLGAGGKFTVQWTDFINAPGWALFLDGYGSSVSLSNFGKGGYGYAPDGSLRQLTGPESATRSTAIWINGSYNGAWYNDIKYAGTAAISLLGSHQYAYGNLLYQNRYEISDGSGGGQLFVGPSSSAASVTGNVIDGNLWPDYSNGRPNLATGCLLPNNAQFNAGVEGYGWDHYFFNNEIERHTGSGMQFAGSEPTGRITISGENPSDPSDTPRYIEMNKAGGIVFLGPYWTPSWPLAAQGVALYRVNVRNNAGFDVVLDGISDDATSGYYSGEYRGFIGNSCIIPGQPIPRQYTGPVAGLPNVNGGLPPPHPNTLTRPLPTSYGAYPPIGTCPDPGWPAQTPAKSTIPGWKW
ncbi:MAG: hypothetical protein IT168_03485 [Bryobacterales bacterium]|nr:hypothetical protein [Bryobacterales bacterium]